METSKSRSDIVHEQGNPLSGLFGTGCASDCSTHSLGHELVLSFGPFRLIPGRQLLLLDDQPVKLGGRSFELLHVLAHRSGQLISKEELITAAWPDTYVHESNLKVNMSHLRRALGDIQSQPIYVATIAGRGYRFVAPVQLSTCADGGIPAKSSELSGLPPWRDIVGREREIAAIQDELRASQHVTVVGTGGIGKTTVALAAARAFEPNCPDGICFVDLSTVDDPALVPAALAAALGIRGNPGDTLAAVIDYLRPRRVLVVLDNCEHVLPAAAMFANRFAADNLDSKLLATSREPLDTSVERVVWLDPLACAGTGAVLTARDAVRFPAVDLFARRALEWAGYQLVDADCEAIAQVCRAVDGLPLAIELAAANTERHAPSDLLAMLDKHLSFRGRNAEGAPPRHETLQATIDWSFRLLSPSEAAIFRLVSVFADAFELDDVAAIAVAADLKPAHVITGLGGLVAKSLVTAQVNGAGLSYRLLDSTRRYAIARRQESPIDAPALRCHARRMLAFFKQAEDECDWRHTRHWSGRYRGRLADLRAALSWAFEGNDPALGIELTVAAIPLWSEISLLSEAQQWVALALKMADTFPCDDLLKTKLACSRGWGLFYGRKLGSENEDIWLSAIAHAERAGNFDYHMRGLLGLSFYLLQIGQIGKAIERLEELSDLSQRHRGWPGAPDGDRALAWAKAHAGDLTTGWRVLARQAEIYARPDKRTRVVELDIDRYISTRFYLPIVAWLTGKVGYAATIAQEAVEAAAEVGHLVSQSNALALAALPVALYNGDLGALEHYTAQLQSVLEREHIARWTPAHKYFAAAIRDLNGDQSAVCDMRDSIDELIECRYLMRIGMYLGNLADALLRRGQLDDARDAISMALKYQAQQQERWCRPELQRIKASILHRGGHRNAAVCLLREARDEARAIGAVSFELRVANDLAACYMASGRGNDAIRLLRPVYGRFTEGFVTRDLRIAADLLQRASAAQADESFA
jgi:predicted ATPase/DNA-binding winged helix-turn-helix (wHTH) protein